MISPRRLLSLLLLIAAPFAARGADAPATGEFRLTFTQRSDLSTNVEICHRMGWELMAEAAAKVDYNLPDESFEVYIPSDYTGEKPFGLFVFVSPSPSGRLMGMYRKSMDERHLIWIGPNKCGNDRINRPRMGLPIDAAISMKARYNIDPDRVYIAGVSGGGRIASMLGVGFPDIFKGGFYMIGCNFYRRELSTEQKGRYFERSYSVPPAKIFAMARKQSKHVFLTGDDDPNREQTDLYYKGFKRDGFDHITYLQVPGMPHRAPDPEWFEKGMAALDEKLPATPVAAKPAVTPAKPATRPAPTAATEPSDPAYIADRLLTRARLYVDNKQYELSREKLNWIIEHFPTTPAAAQASKILADIKDK